MLVTALLIVLPAAAMQPANCSRGITASQRVDTTLVQRADIDGDGQPDELRLRLTAPRFDQPFQRLITIVSNGRTLLERSSTDVWLDSIFKTETFGLQCDSYLSCKCEWYYNRILRRVVQPSTSLGKGVFDPAAPNSIQHVAEAHLVRSCGASPSSAQAAIRNAITRLQTGTSVFVTLPISPAQSDQPLYWFPEFSCFAPIYLD